MTGCKAGCGVSPRPRARRRRKRRRRMRQCSQPGHCRAAGELGSPGPGRGLGTVRFSGKVDELFELNLVQMPMLGRNTVLEAKERTRRDGRAISASLICISECSALGWLWFNPGEPVLSPSLTSRCSWRAGQGQEHGWEGGGGSSRSREQSCPCSAHTLPQPAIEPSPGPPLWMGLECIPNSAT